MNSSMKFLIFLAISMAFFQSAMTAIASERIVPTRDEPNKCVRTRDNVNLAVGQTQFRSGCSKVSCRTTGGQLYIDEETCGIVKSTSGCRRVANRNKSYPDCCTQVSC